MELLAIVILGTMATTVGYACYVIWMGYELLQEIGAEEEPTSDDDGDV